MQEQYTIRAYDIRQIKKIEDTYKKCKDLYKTKSPFLVDCVIRGIEILEKELLGENDVKNVNDLYDEIKATVNKLDLLLKLSEKNAKETIANLTVTQRLLSSNYNMLLGISNEAPRKTDLVEAGMYDDLPERLNTILEELLKVILKK